MQLHSSRQSQKHVPEVSGVIKVTLMGLFALLWAIWIQPHTIALRHILLTLGSLIGLYVISQNLSLFKTRLAIPVYLMGLLFAWVTFHLFFLSHQYELQLEEYFTIWKRIALSAPFATGLGIAFSGPSSKKNSYGIFGAAGYEGYWWIFYAGIVAPTLIYLVRTILMLLAAQFGLQLPNFALHSPASSTWHIAKIGIVFFCLPALALACGQCIRIASNKTQPPLLLSALYVGTIVAVLTVFYLENTKNGIIYSVVLILAMAAKIGMNKRGQWSWRHSLISVMAIVAMTCLVVRHVQQNDSWKTLFSDIPVAQQLNEIDAWKDYGVRGYPVNDLGRVVSETNYLRVAWYQIIVGFIREIPLGYGLVYKSFGNFAHDKWPESTLFQAHSAWLDLTLGIGIPGVFILVLAGVLALKNALRAEYCFWGDVALWILSSISLLMATTEVSQSIYINALVFMIFWAAGLGFGCSLKVRSSHA